MIPNNFILTTLSNNPEYFEDVLSLIEEEFHYSETSNYEVDFAPLMNPLNFENCFLYVDRETGTVASHLGVCLRTMIKNGHELKIALIGGIATKKDYRRKNLFSSLMNHAITTYQEQVGLFILWSDLENLYEKFLFSRAGGFIETGKRSFSDSDRPAGFEKTTFSKLSDKDFSTIIHLYRSFNQQFFFTIKRDEKDWSIIREMSSIDLFVKRNAQDEIDNYFCINKGKDLSNIIHEVSCANADDFHNLLKKLGAFKLWLPENTDDLFSSSEIYYTAFMRIGSEKTLNSFFEKITHGNLKIESKDNDKIVFLFNNESFTASPKNFLQYVFGPRPLEELTPFRLSLYVAGTDSI